MDTVGDGGEQTGPVLGTNLLSHVETGYNRVKSGPNGKKWLQLVTKCWSPEKPGTFGYKMFQMG
jgi:hypothetical protein